MSRSYLLGYRTADTLRCQAKETLASFYCTEIRARIRRGGYHQSMCGRFTLHHDAEAIATRFQAILPDLDDFEVSPRYNIAPTQRVLGIVPARVSSNSDTRSGLILRWGLVPRWAKDTSGAARMINARSETITDKPAFRDAFQRRRCLIPADGFYEWQSITPKEKQPIHFRRSDGALFAFAAIWERWKSPDTEENLLTCSLLTTRANGVVAPFHDRMPVLLTPEDEAVWLDAFAPEGDVLNVLRPYPESLMTSYAVSPRMNSPRHDTPSNIVPVV